jgi:AcrR family transcriptional regulator
MASSTESGQPRLRADAERNRAKLLDAAADLFAAKGLSVGLDEIARHAGVGVATAYRRFPDKEVLIQALFEERLDAFVANAERALAAADPWRGLAGFMEAAIELHVANRGLRELVFGSRHGAAFVAGARARVAPLLDELVRRAQAGGQLRADLEPTDLTLLQFMVASLADLPGRRSEDVWRRCLGIALDGLRAEGAHELARPPLTRDELDAVVRRTAGA